jgi:Response regulator containing CheY-like receiver domain and AraC-type DNA-binding domain
MRKIMIVDDDSSVIDILKIIIEEKNLGTVCGSSQSPEDALEDIVYLKPDIVIVDLLMPKIDGISFVKKAAAMYPDASFVMLSQVSAKEMIARAYDAGVEFFLQKPVNGIEVTNVLNNIFRLRSLQQKMDQIQSLFGDTPHDAPAAAAKKKSGSGSKKLQTILRQLGIAGESGYQDIVTIVEHYIDDPEEFAALPLKDVCGKFSDNPKTVEQRIRRAAAAGMNNLANMGLEDYDNDFFLIYSGSLYSFEQVRREMNFCRGKSDQHGYVKIKRFLLALISACSD